MDPARLQKDRQSLRERWYAEGHYGNDTLSDAFGRALHRNGAVPFHFYTENGTRSTTASELRADALKLAGALSARGIGAGDVIAVQLPTSYETAIIYQAILHLGAVLLPIVHVYGTHEVGYILRDSRAKALFIPDRWRGIDFLERSSQMGRLPDLDQLFVVGDEVPKAAVSFRELLCDGRIESSTTRVDPDAVCILLYTSGTTSAPKGVQLTHNNILAEYQGPLYMTNGPFLSCFPAGHIAGLNFLLRPLICGVSSVYLDRWDPALAAELIVRHSLRESGGVPYFLTSLLQAAKSAGHSLTTLEAFSLGGSSVTPEHVRMTDQNRCPGGRIYGLTEHSTVTYCDSGFSFEQRAFTDGRVARGNEVQIVDDAGIVLPVGEQGEITTRGPEMFVGYTDDALNEECFLPGGWFRTGDIGRCSKDNFLTVTDRKKDIIIRGGENISSKEVEDALIRHPAVLEAAAVAMPDDTMGERVCAFVIAQPQATLSLEEVRQHFQRLGIAKQKTPEKLQLVTELPRTPSGKIRKVELRSQLRSHTNRNFGPNV